MSKVVLFSVPLYRIASSLQSRHAARSQLACGYPRYFWVPTPKVDYISSNSNMNLGCWYNKTGGNHAESSTLFLLVDRAGIDIQL
jgi:hypothetical protein